MRSHFFLVAMLFGLLLIGRRASAEPVRLAIVSSSPDASAVGDLLTAELSSKSDVQLLERNEISKVYSEQALVSQNPDYIRIGKILGADGVLEVQFVREGANSFLSTKLIAVNPGVVLSAERYSIPSKAISEWASGYYRHLIAYLPKLSVTEKDAVPISLVSIRSALRGSEQIETERQVKLLTIERLTREPQRVFAGPNRAFNVTWQNTGSKAATADLQMRLVQTSTWTTTVIGDSPWKQLQVLPSQTVLEEATLDFPAVKAETRFLVQWLAGTNQVLGTTEVLVYPTNLLAELSVMVGEEGTLGVFDPTHQLKPLLGGVGVEFQDLEDTGVASFRGQLAILGPFDSRKDMPADLTRRVQEMAGKGMATVWMQPAPDPRDKLRPSFETVAVGAGTVVVMQHDLVPDLAVSPQSQLNLIHCCRLALQPEPPRLPDMNR
jgi:hypothetical protein